MKQEAIESVPTPTIVAAFWGAFVSSVGNLPPHLSLIFFYRCLLFFRILLEVRFSVSCYVVAWVREFWGGDLLPPI